MLVRPTPILFSDHHSHCVGEKDWCWIDARDVYDSHHHAHEKSIAHNLSFVCQEKYLCQVSRMKKVFDKKYFEKNQFDNFERRREQKQYSEEKYSYES